MFGLEMMLKSMGLEPEEVMSNMTNLVSLGERLEKHLSEIDARLARIEKAMGIVNPPSLTVIEGEAKNG